MNKITTLILSMLIFAQPVGAASFDCAKASTKVEKMICADPELSKLDEDLSAAYSKALKKSSDPSGLKQRQRDWLKKRNKCADKTCLKSAYQRRSDELKDVTVQVEATSQPEIAMTGDSGRPGFYRLYKSTNDSVCVPLGRLINADIKKYGETRFDTHSEFAKWNKVDEKRVDRGEGGYDGWVQRADVDINNDGIIDQVIRTPWSMSGVMNDALNVFPGNYSKSIVIDDLIKSDKKIMFNANNYWLERYQKKYGDPLLVRWDWYFSGIASLNLFSQDNITYVIAHNYAAPPDVSAKIYVFQLDKNYTPYEERDVCMYLKTCPCKGCVDLRGDEVGNSLPASKWCK